MEIFIGTGMKTAVQPFKCYWTNTYIAQGDFMKQLLINPFGQPVNNVMDVDLDIIKMKRVYSQ